jgi:hypothetical protein
MTMATWVLGAAPAAAAGATRESPHMAKARANATTGGGTLSSSLLMG